MNVDAKGRRQLVLGAGATGRGVARFLTAQGGQVCVADRSDDALASADLPPTVARCRDDEVVDIGHFDTVVVSPGVARDHPQLLAAQRAGVPILSEIELAYRALEIPLLGVTGTNGKSTTTVLIGEMLRRAGIETFVGGNLGTPLIEACNDGRPYRVAVVEVSSFQLEWVSTLRPRLAVLLNLTPDHLDRSADMEEYGRAHAHLLRMQEASDYAVLNRDDAWVWDQRRQTRAAVISFGRERVEFGGYLDGDAMVVCGPSASPQRYELGQAPLQGAHNRENLLAAATAATVWGVAPEAIAAAVASVRGLPHRLELVRERDGVCYYDDSKGTNVGAVAKSVASFPDNVILLLGGYDKGGDFASLGALLDERVRAVIAFGAAGPEIDRQIGDRVETNVVAGLADAVAAAAAIARRGDRVALSPGCASFDEFRDYQHRGRSFRAWVEAL